MRTRTRFLGCVSTLALAFPAVTSGQVALLPEDFVAAARLGDENAVRRTLSENPALVDSRDQMGLTALDWAATREHWPIFRQLLAAGADIQNQGFDGGTVLHRVSHFNRPELVEALLEAGADPDLQNRWGRTALHVASRRGMVAVAEVLVGAGADLEAETREGWTPLHVAHRSGHPAMIEWLVEAGANLLALDHEGGSPADHIRQRPPRWTAGGRDPCEYQGHYRINERASFTVRCEKGELTLQDFSDVPLFPTGPDEFFTEHEPWGVRFVRNERGRVAEVEVQFLRRAETGSKEAHPEYVGSQKCGECHASGEFGGPYLLWLRSRHGSAYWRLSTDWAGVLASQRPHFGDLTNPAEDDRCLNCHTTGALDEMALFSRDFRIEEGVGCEACHGPGSAYANRETMASREAFLAAGGRIPSAGTCLGCHRNPEAFSFDTWWPRIAHNRPSGQR